MGSNNSMFVYRTELIESKKLTMLGNQRRLAGATFFRRPEICTSGRLGLSGECERLVW